MNTNDLSIVIRAVIDPKSKEQQELLQKQLTELSKNLKIVVQIDTKQMDGLTHSFHAMGEVVEKTQTKIKKFYIDSKMSAEGYGDLNKRVEEIKKSAQEFDSVVVKTFKNTNNIKSAIVSYRDEMGRLVKEELKWTEFLDKKNNTTKKVFQPVGYTFVDKDPQGAKLAKAAFEDNEKQIGKLNNIISQVQHGLKGVKDEGSIKEITGEYQKLINYFEQLQLEESKMDENAQKWYINELNRIKSLTKAKKEAEVQANSSTINYNQKQIDSLKNLISQVEHGLKGVKSTEGVSSIVNEYKKLIPVFENLIAENKQLDEAGREWYMNEMNRIKAMVREKAALESRSSLHGTYTESDFNLDKDKFNRSVDAAHAQYGRLFDFEGAKKLQDELKGIDHNSEGARQRIKEINEELRQLKTNASMAGHTFQNELIHDMGKMGTWMIAGGAIFGTFNALKEVGQQIIEIDKNLVEMSKVLSSQTDLKQLMGDIVSTSNEYGRSLTESQEALIEFGKAGYEATEALKLTDATLLGANVTGLKTAQMADYLTGTLVQFNMSADQATDVINKINEVDNNFSVTSIGLAQSLSKAGESAQQFGVSLDDLLAMTTLVSQSTHESGTVIGNMFKSTFARLNMDKTQAALESIGVAVSDVNGEMRSATAIYADVAEKWDGMTRAQKTNLAEALAGKYHINRMMAMLDNWTDKEKGFAAVSKTSQNSFGSALEENKKHIESLDAKMNQMKASGQELAFAIGESGVSSAMKVSIESITTFVKGVTVMVNSLGGANMTMIALIGTVALFGEKIRSVAISLNALFVKNPWVLAAVGLTTVTVAAINALGKAKEQTEQFEKTNSKAAESWTKHRDQVDQLLQKYEELAQAKDNGALDPEQEQQYYSVQKQLDLLLPQLTDHIDENGNAIIKRGKALEEEKQRLDELVVKWQDYQRQNGTASLTDNDTKLRAKANEIDDIKRKLKDGGEVNAAGFWMSLSDGEIAELKVQLINLEREFSTMSNKSKDDIGKIVDTFVQLDNTSSDRLHKIIANIDLLGKDSNKIAIGIGDALKTLDNAKKGGDPKEIAFATAHLRELLETYGVAPEKINPFINSVLGIKDAVEKTSKSTVDLDAMQKSLNKGLDDFIKNNDDLSKIYEKLKDGQSLSVKEINDLVSKYPELTSAIEVHNGMLSLSQQAVEALMNAKEQEFKSDLQMKQQELINQENALTSKLAMYSREIEAIENVAQAKQVAASVRMENIRANGGGMDATDDIVMNGGMEDQFVDIGKIRQQKSAIQALMGAKLGANLSSASGGSKSSKSSTKNDPAYEDFIDAVVNQFNAESELLKQKQELTKAQAELASKNKDYNKELVLTTSLLEEQKQRVDALTQSNEKIANEREYLKNQYSEFDISSWFTENGEQSLDYINQFNDASKEAQDRMKAAFDQISKLNKAYDNNLKEMNQETSAIADSIAKIHQSQMALLEDNLQAQKNRITDIDHAIEMSKSNQALFEQGTKEYSSELLKQIDLNMQRIQAEEEYEKKVRDTLDTAKDLTAEEKKQLQLKIDESIKARNESQLVLNQAKNKLADDVIATYKAIYERQKKTALQALEDAQDVEEKRHRDVMNHLEDEQKKYEDNVKRQTDAIDRATAEEDYLAGLKQDEEDAKELRQKIDQLALDDSHGANTKRIELEKQLKDKQLQIQKEKRDHQRDIIKQGIQDAADIYKDDIDAKKKAEDEKNHINKDSLEQQKEDTEKKYDELINDEEKWARIRNDILHNNFAEVEKDFGTFAKYLKENSQLIGTSITENLIKKMQDAQKEIQDLLVLQQKFDQQQGQTDQKNSNASSSAYASQMAYLQKMVAGGGGNAVWAQNQIDKMKALTQNQYDFLYQTAQNGGGNGEWAKVQFQNAGVDVGTIKPKSTTSSSSTSSVSSSSKSSSSGAYANQSAYLSSVASSGGGNTTWANSQQSAIDKLGANQYNYLMSLAKGSDGNAEWAKDQLRSAGIQYYHNGGWVGNPLRSDEVPAILKHGEYVLSEKMISAINNIPQIRPTNIPNLTKSQQPNTIQIANLIEIGSVTQDANLNIKQLVRDASEELIRQLKPYGFIK